MNVCKINDKMTKKEKVIKLSRALEQLKQEFVGLDSIIDEIGKSISIWYITPELLTRPAVVSLWGMTGTGKSSVVRRLIEILDLRGTSAFLDCGEYLAEGKNMASDLCDMLSISEESLDSKVDIPTDTIIALDEFQYARTLNEAGEEVTKATLRPIWSLIDTGIISINEYYSWGFSNASAFIDDFSMFVKMKPDAKIEKNCLTQKEDVRILLETLGLIYYNNRYLQTIKDGTANSEVAKLIEGMDLEEEKPISSMEDELLGNNNADKDDPYRPINVLLDEHIRSIIKRLTNCKRTDLAKELLTCSFTAEEYLEKLQAIKKLISVPRELNLSKSLIFIIGNLDEAFGIQGKTNPDFDADVFNEITNEVSIQDIKSALKDRFRAEQIARLGNNLIKYPTLRREHFQIIIEREVNRLVNEFMRISPGMINSIEIDQKFYELLYSEGVYPVQGVRPVFTTINSMITPIFSTILIEKEDEEKDITISVKEDLFNVDKVTISVKFSGKQDRVVEFPLALQLGSLRNPKNRNTRFAAGIHEAGHAVVFSYLTGELPKVINAISVDGGGFCTTYRKDKVRNREDVDNDVMISMAGFLSESHFFSQSKILLGSKSDINQYWDYFKTAVGKCGYFEPVPFTLYEADSSSEIPDGGFDITKTHVRYFNGHETTSELLTVEQAMIRRIQDLQRDTEAIIAKEERLIKEVGIRLGEKGIIRPDEFLSLVKEFGVGIDISTKKKEMSNNYYENKLKGL